MDAAENAGQKNVTEHATRYIITRPCLAEGSLRLLKYLQPLFPHDGPLTLQDSRGERFPVTVDRPRGRVTGMGDLYRTHNMGVNDVLLLTPAGEREFTVDCVVKPHARPAPSSDRPARPAPTPPPVLEKRVVIHATPHVREVRTERVSAEQVQAEQARSDARTAAGGTVLTRGGQTQAAQQQTAQKPSGETRTVQVRADRPAAAHGGAQQDADAAPQTQSVQSQAVQPQATQATAQPVVTPPAASPAVQKPAQTGSVTAITTRPGGQPHSTPAPQVVRLPVTPAPTGTASAPATTAAAATLTRPQNAPVTVTLPAPAQEGVEDRLATLARLTGYTCDHLGSGVVRLRAELGNHSYSVLLATTPQALTTPAWREPCDYMALLTREDERPQGIPRFTLAALDALLEHARLAPLSPIDLRGYWNTGSFDQESVESVAELVSAHLAQRGSFSHVLLTLAQQPAHSLVQVPRLAERLGSGVNTAELHSVLETLSRPPFLALTPMPGGQYYLRGDVRDLLHEFGEYAEGMRRRLRPVPLAATGH